MYTRFSNKARKKKLRKNKNIVEFEGATGYSICIHCCCHSNILLYILLISVNLLHVCKHMLLSKRWLYIKYCFLKLDGNSNVTSETNCIECEIL